MRWWKWRGGWGLAWGIDGEIEHGSWVLFAGERFYGVSQDSNFYTFRLCESWVHKRFTTKQPPKIIEIVSVPPLKFFSDPRQRTGVPREDIIWTFWTTSVQKHKESDMSEKNGKKGILAGSSIGFGAVLAMVMSWTANKAVGWALIHGILGWVYVVYYLIVHRDWTWF